MDLKMENLMKCYKLAKKLDLKMLVIDVFGITKAYVYKQLIPRTDYTQYNEVRGGCEITGFLDSHESEELSNMTKDEFTKLTANLPCMDFKFGTNSYFLLP